MLTGQRTIFFFQAEDGIRDHCVTGVQTSALPISQVFDDRLTRGGPVVKRVANDFWYLNVNSDSRKRIVARFNGSYSCNDDGDCGNSTSLSLQLKPRSNVSVSLGPSYNRSLTSVQFVGSYADPTATNFFGTRYVFAHLTQNTIS